MLFALADLEWKITWVGSPESVEYDQILDQVFVGPVTRGQYKFVFEVGCDQLPCTCSLDQELVCPVLHFKLSKRLLNK